MFRSVSRRWRFKALPARSRPAAAPLQGHRRQRLPSGYWWRRACNPPLAVWLHDGVFRIAAERTRRTILLRLCRHGRSLWLNWKLPRLQAGVGMLRGAPDPVRPPYSRLPDPYQIPTRPLPDPYPSRTTPSRRILRLCRVLCSRWRLTCGVCWTRPRWEIESSSSSSSSAHLPRCARATRGGRSRSWRTDVLAVHSGLYRCIIMGTLLGTRTLRRRASRDGCPLANRPSLSSPHPPPISDGRAHQRRNLSSEQRCVWRCRKR